MIISRVVSLVTFFSVLCCSIVLARPQASEEQFSQIVGGNFVHISDHPYQLSLQILGKHICGATIINKKWAVTAAHCLTSDEEKNYNYYYDNYYEDSVNYYDASFFTLRAGSSRHDRGGSQYQVQQIVPHPLFDPQTMDYDIALIKVKTAFRYGENIRPASLPPRWWRTGFDATANITGWGTTRDTSFDFFSLIGLMDEGHGDGMSTYLKEATVTILSHKVCSGVYPQLTSRMFCAGQFPEGGKDTCQGDSGGPLVIREKLVGVVSWGDGCARRRRPGVYTKVSKVRDWILNSVRY